MSAGQYEDMQSAPRFPLHLAASVKTQGARIRRRRRNLSQRRAVRDGQRCAGGIDGGFHDSAAGRSVWVRGDNVQIDCRGRVVRSFEDRGRRGVGVVIDEYHFERA